MEPNTEMPLYRLLEAFYAENDSLYEAGTEIRYEGVPNEYMQPLNEPARLRLADYLPTIDRRPRDEQIADARERERTRPISVIPQPTRGGHDLSAPLMPDPHRRPKPSASLVGDAKAPEAGDPRKTKKVFGSVIVERGGEAQSRGGYSE